MPVWAIIISSAAVGSLVTVLGQMVGHWFETRARRRELLLVKALEVAKWRMDVARHPEENDLLTEMDRCYVALSAVHDGLGVPLSELARIKSLVEMRVNRRAREEDPDSPPLSKDERMATIVEYTVREVVDRHAMLKDIEMARKKKKKA